MAKKQTPALADPMAIFAPAENEAPVTVREKHWLDRISLLTGESKAVKKGKAKAKQFQFGKDTFLEEEVVVLILVRRNHAVWLKNNKPFKESYDITSKTYGEIAAVQEATKNDNSQSAMVGDDFLVYVPCINQFGYFHVTKTALDNVLDWDRVRPGKTDAGPAVMASEEKENPQYVWRIPTITPAPGTELATTFTAEQGQKAMTLFQNPTPQGEQESTSTKGGRKARK